MGIVHPVGFFSSGGYESIDLEPLQCAYITHAAQSGLDLTTLTIEAWGRFESLPSSASYYIAAKYAGTGGGYAFSVYEASSTYYLKLEWGDGLRSDSEEVVWSSSPSAETWYHMAVSYIYVTDTSYTNFYVDGSQMGSEQTSSGDPLSTCTNDFYVGAYSGLMCWDGELCEVRAWSDVRTQTEIDDNKDARLTSGSNLVSVWPFSGHADDVVGSNDLTEVGSPVYSLDGPF